MKRSILCLTAALFSSALSLPAEVIFAEQFPENSRTTQSPPNSLQWYSSDPDGTVVEGGSISLTRAAEKMQSVWAALPPVSLGVGDRLVFTCTFRLDGEVGLINSGMMVALLNTFGEVGNDEAEPMLRCAGYRLQIGNSQHTKSQQPFTVLALDERNDEENPQRMLSGHAGYKRIASGGPMGTFPYEQGGSYELEFTIERVSEGALHFFVSVVGGSFAEPQSLSHQAKGDEGDFVFAFDTIGLTINGSAERGGFPAVTFSSLKLELQKIGE